MQTMKTIRRLTVRGLLWLLSLMVLKALGVFGIDYLHPVDNIPFENPVTVVQVDDTTVTLNDGRRLRPPEGVDEDWLRRIQESKSILGLEVLADGTVRVYGRRLRTICGLGRPMLVLPIIPVNVPRYQRTELSSGCPIEMASE